jgi:cation diffusion facilitator CzcD-associated flavoprotein CzcO
MTDVDLRLDRHLIVGAGFSGLGVAAAFGRRGIAYDQVEADDDIGGNWYHGVYETVHIISSRKTTEFTDWPMPADWPDFPSAEQMLSYLRAYADRWRLRDRIELSTRVVLVEPADTGTWRVTIEKGGQRSIRIYGGVVVCNGHHWDPRWPEYPGEFTGEKIHAKHYKKPSSLVGKRVLVIGGGNSACDIAVEAARFADAAHISLRRGYWFLPKTMLGVPTAELMRPWVPRRAQRAIIKSLARIIVGPYTRYGLAEPDHQPFEHHPTINTELLHNLRHGRIVAHPDIARWDGDHVVFVDGARERFDLVVCATGYHVSFPFLAPGIVEIRDGMAQLIGGVMPPEHKNFYVFGLGQPRYGAGPLITAGADLLCTMVTTQRELDAPLGGVLRRLGARPPTTYLADPFAVLRSVRIGKRVLPRLPRFEKWIMA